MEWRYNTARRQLTADKIYLFFLFIYFFKHFTNSHSCVRCLMISQDVQSLGFAVALLI